MKNLTTCLWFDTQGEAAAQFYTSLFPNSRIVEIARYGSAGPREEGTVMTVSFELDGNRFVALNGGPQYKFNAAVSVMVPCQDQAEVDYYWSRLTEGGAEIACGWLVDKFGLSWQVFPTVFLDMVTDPDPEKVRRVTEAMFTMKKFDIAALQQAYAGG